MLRRFQEASPKIHPSAYIHPSAEVIGRVAPLPLVAIHSTGDEFVGVAEIERVMSRAREPKQLWLIEADDHRFSGKEQDLNQKLMSAVAWIKAQRR